MQFKGMLLMCSALITLAYSFPTDTQNNITTMHQNDTNLLSTKENEKPLVLIVEEKDSESDSVIVQFIYTSSGSDGNSIIQTTGQEKDKYTIKNPDQEKDKKSNENDARKLQNSNTQKIAQRHNDERKAKELNIQIASLVPEEESPLSAKWPKYFYDSFNPIKPFPELHPEKSNQIITDKVEKERDETHMSNNGKEKKHIPFVAGPQLNPLSIYDRELYVPIFD